MPDTTDEELSIALAWFEATKFCRPCNRRVRKEEIRAGKHRHPEVA
jgi:hypothetical protein